MPLVKGLSADDLVSVIDFGSNARRDVNSGSTTTPVNYSRVSSTSVIGNRVVESNLAKKTSSGSSLINTIFGKSAVSGNSAFMADLIGKIHLPVEVDCDPSPSSSDRLKNSVGLAASNSMTSCTVLDVIKNLDASKAVMVGAVTIGSTAYAVKGKDLTTAQGLAKMYTQLPSVQSPYLDKAVGYTDTGTELSFAKRLMDESLRIGIPQMIDKVVAQFSSPESKRALYLSQVRSSCIRSYLDNVQAAIDYCGVGAVIAAVPDVVQLIIRYYRYRGNTGGMTAELTKVKTLLSTLAPGWELTVTDTTTYKNFTPFMRASADAQDLFLLDPELYVYILVADKNGNESITSMVRRMYPYLRLR